MNPGKPEQHWGFHCQTIHSCSSSRGMLTFSCSFGDQNKAAPFHWLHLLPYHLEDTCLVLPRTLVKVNLSYTLNRVILQIVLTKLAGFCWKAGSNNYLIPFLRSKSACDSYWPGCSLWELVQHPSPCGAGDPGEWGAFLGGLCKAALILQRNHTKNTSPRTLQRRSHHQACPSPGVDLSLPQVAQIW